MKDILEFIKSIATTITWPLAVLIIAYMFRRQLHLTLRALTSRIETAEQVSVGKDGLIVLQKRLEVAEKKAENAEKNVEALVVAGTQNKESFEESKRRLQEKNSQKKFTAENLEQASKAPGAPATLVAPDPDDPQKGQWGGSPVNNNRELKAKVTSLPGSIPLYRIELEVVSTNTFYPLTGKVTFHLHPSFAHPTIEVDVVDGKATLSILSYGSFTVGAEADNGLTKLELDLEELEGVSEHFRTT